MVNENNWLIKRGYLRNFEEYIKVFSLENCKEIVLIKQEVDSLNIIGSYVIKKNEIIAYYFYQNEVIFVINNKLYNLSNSNYQLTVENIDDNKRMFKIITDNKIAEKFEYERQKYINFDPWSEEDDIDFFAWFTNFYNKQK